MREARESRLKRKFDKEPKVAVFSGTGQRVDGKKTVENPSPAVSEGKELERERSVGKFAKKRMTEKPVFTGTGYSMK